MTHDITELGPGKARKPRKQPAPRPAARWGIYLVNSAPKGSARLVAARGKATSTTFSDRYARRFPTPALAEAYLTADRRSDLAGFRPMVIELAPRSKPR